MLLHNKPVLCGSTHPGVGANGPRELCGSRVQGLLKAEGGAGQSRRALHTNPCPSPGKSSIWSTEQSKSNNETPNQINSHVYWTGSRYVIYFWPNLYLLSLVPSSLTICHGVFFLILFRICQDSWTSGSMLSLTATKSSTIFFSNICFFFSVKRIFSLSFPGKG